jgi:zinc transporter ZupT
MFYNNSLFPLLLSTIAGLSTLVGAIIIFFTQSKNEKFLTFALGFSAGVMIAVSFMDLFPTAESSISKYHGNTPGILWSIFFMLIGAIIAYLIDLLIPESTPNHDIKYDRSGIINLFENKDDANTHKYDIGYGRKEVKALNIIEFRNIINSIENEKENIKIEIKENVFEINIKKLKYILNEMI